MFPVAAIAALVASASGPRLRAQPDDFDQEPIGYSSATPHNRVSRLAARLRSGEWQPPTDDPRAFLAEVLRALEVPIESQVLVFSKTSHQNSRIAPRTPRALYFSDDCWVGWVQGGDVELACADPALGTVFYLLSGRHEARPRFERTASCLSCHASSRTDRVPGLLVRSVYPDAAGFPILSRGSFTTRPSSPLEERWGGWYVTGIHGTHRHLGNGIAEQSGDGAELDVEAGANRTSIAELFPVAPYLTDTSDIVALMVLEHEVAVHDALTRASFNTRRAIWRQRELRRALEEPEDAPLEGSALRAVEHEAERVVAELLSSGEAPLRDEVRGSDAFRGAFLRGARRSRDGLSLRELDLRTRLFRHRLSFMIHAPSFDALPDEIRTLVLERLVEVLTDETPAKEFRHLEERERAAILRIVADTKPKLPASWHAAVAALR